MCMCVCVLCVLLLFFFFDLSIIIPLCCSLRIFVSRAVVIVDLSKQRKKRFCGCDANDIGWRRVSQSKVRAQLVLTCIAWTVFCTPFFFFLSFFRELAFMSGGKQSCLLPFFFVVVVSQLQWAFQNAASLLSSGQNVNQSIRIFSSFFMYASLSLSLSASFPSYFLFNRSTKHKKLVFATKKQRKRSPQRTQLQLRRRLHILFVSVVRSFVFFFFFVCVCFFWFFF